MSGLVGMLVKNGILVGSTGWRLACQRVLRDKDILVKF